MQYLSFPVNVYHLLGRWYLRRQKYEKSLRLLQRAIALQPDNLNVLWEVGIVKGYLDDFQGAVEAISRLVLLAPGNADALAALGAAQANLGDAQSAEKFYSDAIRLRDDFGRAYLGRGKARMGLNRWEVARSDFAKCIELGFSAEEAEALKTLALLELGEIESAQESADSLLQNQSLPDDCRWIPPFVLGSIEYRAGNYVSAHKLFGDAITSNLHLPYAIWIRLASSLFMLGQVSLALEVLETSAGVPPVETLSRRLEREGKDVQLLSLDVTGSEHLSGQIAKAALSASPPIPESYYADLLAILETSGASFSQRSERTCEISRQMEGVIVPFSRAVRWPRGCLKILLVSRADDAGQRMAYLVTPFGYSIRILETYGGVERVLQELDEEDFAMVMATDGCLTHAELLALGSRLRNEYEGEGLVVLLRDLTPEYETELRKNGVSRAFKIPEDLHYIGGIIAETLAVS